MWAKKRIEIGIPLDAFVLISVGELNVNKNNKVIIEALEKLQNRNIHYCLCGVGNQRNYLQTQADNAGLRDNVHFLGYRSDIKDLLLMADVYVMPSIREGLSRSLMEAMACGLPCVASKIRGNVDLLDEGKGGYLRDVTDLAGFSECLKKLADDDLLRKRMSEYNLESIKNYDVKVVKEEIKIIYSEV